MSRTLFAVIATAVAAAIFAAPAWAIPDTSITSAPPAFSNSPNATFEFSATEMATFECKLDAEVTFTACPTPHQISNLSQGSHTLTVRATSAAGGPDPTPASHTWTVDFTAPETTLTNQPPPNTSSPNATFEFTSNEAGTFECSLNDAPFSLCSSPVSYMGLTDGTRNFKVRARDQATNADITPASVTWNVDATGPDTSITGGPNGPSNAPTPSFPFTSTEEGSTFECALDGSPFSGCASPFSAPGLADGPHTFQVRAIDAVGNPDLEPASRAWTRDTVAPPKPTFYVAPVVSKVRKSAERVPKTTAKFQTANKFRAYWSGSGATGFTVTFKIVKTGLSPLQSQTQTLVSNAPAGSAAVTLNPGFTYCFVATANDAAGNGASTSQICTTIPHKANTMALGPWAKHSGSAYFRSQYVSPPASPAPLRMRIGGVSGTIVSPSPPSPPPSVRRVVLVATKCPTCGKVRVLIQSSGLGPNPGGAVVNKVIDLNSATTKRRSLITVATFPNANPSANRSFAFVQRLSETPRIEGLGFSPT